MNSPKTIKAKLDKCTLLFKKDLGEVAIKYEREGEQFSFTFKDLVIQRIGQDVWDFIGGGNGYNQYKALAEYEKLPWLMQFQWPEAERQMDLKLSE